MVTTVLGGAHGSKGSSTEHGMLTQPKAKDGELIRESDILHEIGKGEELVGKQEGKLTKVEILASTCPISQVKVADSMQWEKGVGPSMLSPVMWKLKYLGFIIVGRTW